MPGNETLGGDNTYYDIRIDNKEASNSQEEAATGENINNNHGEDSDRNQETQGDAGEKMSSTERAFVVLGALLDELTKSPSPTDQAMAAEIQGIIEEYSKKPDNEEIDEKIGKAYEGDLQLGRYDGQEIRKIFENLKTVEGNLIVDSFAIDKLPDGLNVEGNLIFTDETAITELPKDLHIGGYLKCADGIRKISPGLTVGENCMMGALVEELPSGVNIGGTLDISHCKFINELPEDIVVGRVVMTGISNKAAIMSAPRPDGVKRIM